MVQLLIALRRGAELALIEQAAYPRQGSPGFPGVPHARTGSRPDVQRQVAERRRGEKVSYVTKIDDQTCAVEDYK
jgi:hypothetical protein